MARQKTSPAPFRWCVRIFFLRIKDSFLVLRKKSTKVHNKSCRLVHCPRATKFGCISLYSFHWLSVRFIDILSRWGLPNRLYCYNGQASCFSIRNTGRRRLHCKATNRRNNAKHTDPLKTTDQRVCQCQHLLPNFHDTSYQPDAVPR